MFFKAVPAPIRIAQAIGITSAIFASGIGAATSWLMMPALLQTRSAPLLTRQWRATFVRGGKTVVPMSMISAISYLYLTYKFYSLHKNVFGAEWKVNLFSALLMIGSIPYTLFVMGETNSKLSKKAVDLASFDVGMEVEEEESAHQLVDLWTTLNAGRAAIFGLSGLAGTYAALG